MEWALDMEWGQDMAGDLGSKTEKPGTLFRSYMDLKNPFDAQLMTVSEIAEALRVPESWVYERTRRRGSERMPHIKLGKYLRFELTDVRSWLETMRES
jgi:excisionase family DNA binding protein